MKNNRGFYKRSCNNEEARASGRESYASISEASAKVVGVHLYSGLGEWHHSSGGRLDFFPKNDEEKAKIDEVIKKINAISQDLPKSKSAVWRGLVNEDRGFGSVEYKSGKYGNFVCTFGKPDGVLYFPTPEFANVARSILGI